MSYNSKRCTCGSSRDIYCSTCSKISMSILLKNGNDHLKLTNSRGRKVCPVWYSPMKHNGKPEGDIIEKMLHRFFKPKKPNPKHTDLISATRQLNFYENNTSNLLFSFTT